MDAIHDDDDAAMRHCLRQISTTPNLMTCWQAAPAKRVPEPCAEPSQQGMKLPGAHPLPGQQNVLELWNDCAKAGTAAGSLRLGWFTFTSADVSQHMLQMASEYLVRGRLTCACTRIGKEDVCTVHGIQKDKALFSEYQQSDQESWQDCTPAHKSAESKPHQILDMASMGSNTSC